MASSVGDLAINVSTNTASLEVGMRKAFDVVNQTAKRMESAFSGVQKTLAGLGVGLSIAGFAASIKSVIDYADHLNDLSKTTGIAVETLGGLGYAAKQSGVDLDTVAKGVQKLAMSMAEAAGGNKEMTDLFARMGVSIKGLDGALRPLDQVLADVATKFASYADGPEKAALATELFKKGGAALIPLLDEGGAKLAELIAEYERYGGVTTEVAQRSDQFNDTLEKVHLIQGALFREIASTLLPTLQAIANVFLDAKTKGEGFKTAAEGVTVVVKALAIAGVVMAQVFSNIGKALGAIGAMVVAIFQGEFKRAVEINRIANADISADWAKTGSNVSAIWNASTADMAASTASAVPKIIAPLKKVGAAAKEMVDEFAKAMEQFRKLIADAALDLAAFFQTDKITKADQALAAFMQTDRWARLTVAQQDVIKGMANVASETEKTTNKLKEWAEASAEFARDRAKEFEDFQRQQADATKSYESLIEKLDLETATMMMTSEARERYIALQMLEKEQSEGLIVSQDEYIKRLNAINDAFGRRDRAAAFKDEQKGWTDLFNNISDRGSKFIEDFVSHGSSAFKNLWEDFKSWALQALARIAAQQIIVSIVGAVGGTGSTIANAATSSLTGGNSGASIISTLLQKGGSLFGNSAAGSVPTTAAGLGSGSFDYGAGASGADLGGGSLPSSGISNLLSNTYGSIMSGAGSMLFGVGTAGAVAMGAGFSAGVASLSTAFSVAVGTSEAAAAGIAAGTAAIGGTGAALGALGAVAIPVVGWIIAAVALLKAAGVFDHGGPKIGGSATNIPDYGSFFPGEETDAGNKLAQAVVDGTQQSFQAALRSLGGKGTAGFAFGYDTDPEGTADARVSAGAVVNGQNVFTQRDVGAGKDATSAQAALQLEAERALLAALKASDLPTYLASLFDGLDAATASADAITKVIATAQAIRTVAEAIPDLAAQFEKMDAGQINALVDAFGGLAEFTKSAQFIAANFTTSAEKYGQAQADLVKGFDDLGLAVPATHQAFLDLLGSFDPATEAGKQMYAAVSQLAPLFVEVAGTADQAAAALANQIKSATDFFAENFFSDAEKQAVQLAADTALLAKAQQDLGITIPTSIAGFRELVLGIDRSTVAGEALYEALIVLAPAVFDLGKVVETTAAQIVNATNQIATSVGGIINQAAGLANTLLGQFSTLADASPGDFGAKLGIQLNLIADSVKNTDPSQFSSQLGFDTYVGTLQGAAGVLADQLARFTILSAQYDAARAEQLVSLQDWYFAQELIFSRTNNTAALDALRTIFDQKWDAIVSGSTAAVSSLDDFIKKIQELANATGGNAGQQAGIELALSSAQIDKLQGQLAGIDLTSALGQSIQSQIGKLQTYNAGLATQIAHFTTYTAQFGKVTASQLVDLENWYADQQTAFTGNTDALAILGDIFNDKWKAIIDGTNSGVNGTIDAMQRIADYLKGLFVGDLSPLTPLQKLATAKQAYEAELAKAQGGNVAALGDVTKFADVFLNLQRQFSASSPAYTDVFNKVTSDLGTLAGTLPNGQPIPTTSADVNVALVNALPPSGLASSDDFKVLRDLLQRLVSEQTEANTEDSIAEREALVVLGNRIAAAVSGPELP